MEKQQDPETIEEGLKSLILDKGNLEANAKRVGIEKDNLKLTPGKNTDTPVVVVENSHGQKGVAKISAKSLKVPKPPTSRPSSPHGFASQRIMATVRPDQGIKHGLKRSKFATQLQLAGLHLESDPRLKDMREALDDFERNNEESVILPEALSTIMACGGLLVKNAMDGTLIISQFSTFRKEIKEMYDKVKTGPYDHGANADYIAQLKNRPCDHFAVSVTTVDGQHFSIGDSKLPNCLQSLAKPLSYMMALRDCGQDVVHEHVGREPSGQRFNSMTLKKLRPKTDGERAIPHNPMINAGAIITCSMIGSKLNSAERLDAYMDTIAEMCLGKPSFDPEVYLSEKDSPSRNLALTYMMKETNAFPKGANAEEALDFYLQTCSVSMNTEMMSCVAATIANAGTNPYTGNQVFDPEVTRNCLSLMLSCGMYDYSGEWAFHVGLPAKSCASGCVMIVVPNVMGICVYSPPLDVNRNSVRGVEFAKRFVGKYAFHHHDVLRGLSSSKRDPTQSTNRRVVKEDLKTSLLFAAATGQLARVMQIHGLGIDLNVTDYDMRQPLHVAAAGGHFQVVKYLVAHGVKMNVKDRWGHTPLSDAKRGNHKKIVDYLEARHVSQLDDAL